MRMLAFLLFGSSDTVVGSTAHAGMYIFALLGCRVGSQAYFSSMKYFTPTLSVCPVCNASAST